MRALLVLVLCAGAATADVRVAGDRIGIDPIAFVPGKADIAVTSHGTLNAVAALLASHDKIGLVEIGVHTDARGSARWNLALSQKRADAVRAYLVAKGVAGGRLRAKGYGEARPLDRSPRAAARNQRTELRILQQRR